MRRTSMELLNGDTVDISAFRYKFWQELEYYDYEPSAKFPEHQWRLCRFLGIAWDSGDSFIFKIWTEPDGEWKDGCELVHDIVRPRRTVLTTSKQEGPDNSSCFKFQKKVPTKKRRRDRDNDDLYQLQDLQKFNDEDDKKDN